MSSSTRRNRGFRRASARFDSFSRAIVERVEIVDHGDFRALGQEAVHQVRADEAGAAGHDGFHPVTRPSVPSGKRASCRRSAG